MTDDNVVLVEPPIPVAEPVKPNDQNSIQTETEQLQQDNAVHQTTTYSNGINPQKFPRTYKNPFRRTPGQKIVMRTGEEYIVDEHGAFRRLKPKGKSKKERAKEKRMLKMGSK